VLRDRKQLAQDGILTVVVTIDKESLCIIAGPDIVTRGFIYVKESDELLNKARDIVRSELEKCLENKVTEWVVMKTNIRMVLGEFLYSKTKRRPIILPIIMEI
jgi:mRNA degradation ribonuclease J1/J2